MAGEPSAPKRILVVDDSDDLRELYRAILESVGYHVDVASNGRQGLDAVQAARPDVVIADIVMPVMDGLEFLLQLRSNFAPPLPPVILCSGFHTTEEEAHRRGAYAFLTKPIASSDLLLLVEEALAHEPPDSHLLAEEHGRAQAARRAAARAAAEALGETSLDELERRLTRALDFLRGYYGADEVFMAMLRDDQLLALSHRESERFAPLATRLLPQSIEEIITTASSLVLADVAQHASFAADLASLEGVRSFVGVPVVKPGGLVVGALCVARRHIEPFPAEDLIVLEHAGRRMGDLLQAVDSGSADPYQGIGLVELPAGDSGSFELVVDMELRLALREHTAIELALVDLNGDFLLGEAEAIRSAVDPRRMVVFKLTRRRIAIIKRGADSETVSRAVDAGLHALGRVAPIDRVGSMVISASVTGFVDSQTLIHLADRQRSQCSGNGCLERGHLRADGGVLHLQP